MSEAEHTARDPREGEEEDPGLIDDTAPLPAPGAEKATPSEGPDDPPNEGRVPSDPDETR
jgi:hypothetical protein